MCAHLKRTCHNGKCQRIRSRSEARRSSVAERLAGRRRTRGWSGGRCWVPAASCTEHCRCCSDLAATQLLNPTSAEDRVRRALDGANSRGFERLGAHRRPRSASRRGDRRIEDHRLKRNECECESRLVMQRRRTGWNGGRRTSRSGSDTTEERSLRSVSAAAVPKGARRARSNGRSMENR